MIIGPMLIAELLEK